MRTECRVQHLQNQYVVRYRCLPHHLTHHTTTPCHSHRDMFPLPIFFFIDLRRPCDAGGQAFTTPNGTPTQLLQQMNAGVAQIFANYTGQAGGWAGSCEY